jgi:hypothetical protein
MGCGRRDAEGALLMTEIAFVGGYRSVTVLLRR